MKIFSIAAAVGGLIGGLISSVFAPRAVAWYFEPPVEIGINCRPAVEWGIQKFQWAQFGGTVAGAIVALLIARLFLSRTANQNSTKI